MHCGRSMRDCWMAHLATTRPKLPGGCLRRVVGVVCSVMAFAGCAREATPVVDGVLLGLAGHGGVVRCNLTTDSWSGQGELRLGHTAFYSGVGGMVDGAVVLSRTSRTGSDPMSQIRFLSTADGAERAGGFGICPTLTWDGRYIVCYGDQPGAPGGLALLRYRPAESSSPDTLGSVAVPPGDVRQWRDSLWAPVEVDSGIVAVFGLDGAVWTVDVDSGSRRSLGIFGCVPVFWQASRHALVCYDLRRASYFAFDLHGALIAALPELRELVAVGPSRVRDVTLFVAPRRAWGQRTEDYSLVAYTWKTRKTWVVREFAPFMMGRMLWLE